MALVSRRTLAAAGFLVAASAAPLAAQNAPTVTVGGVVYAQFGAQLDSAPPGTNSNFDITRAYFNLLGRFSGGIGTRLTGDIYQNTDGSHSYRLKYAFVTWTPEGSALTYKIGLITTPFIEWEEALWDYRLQGPVPVDRNNFMKAADFGAGIDGKLGPDRLNFQVTAVNGENYSGAGGDQHKDFAARVSLRLLDSDDSSRIGGLRITGYGQLGTPTSGGSRNRFIGMVSYRSKRLLLAGEYLAATDTVTSPASGKRNGSMISIYGFLRLPASRVGIIARMDIVDPNTANNSTATSNDKRTTLIGGVSYQLTSNVRLLADLDYTTLQGSVTGSATAPRKLSQAFFQTQFTF